RYRGSRRGRGPRADRRAGRSAAPGPPDRIVRQRAGEEMAWHTEGCGSRQQVGNGRRVLTLHQHRKTQGRWAGEEGEPGASATGGREEETMLEELMGERVVVDLRSAFVCLGTLLRADEHFLELRNADLHDLRDTDTTRENYVAESKATGIKRNRRRVL